MRCWRGWWRGRRGRVDEVGQERQVGERDDFGTLHAFVLARSERDLGLQA